MITSGLCRVRKPALGGGHRTRGTFNVASAGLCHPDVGDMTRHEKSRVSTPAVVPGATFSPRTVQFWGPDQMPCGPTRQAALPIDLRSRLSPPIASRCETEPASHIRQTGYRGDLISFGRSEGMAKAPRCYGLRDLPFRRVCWDGMASMAFHRSRRKAGVWQGITRFSTNPALFLPNCSPCRSDLGDTCIVRPHVGSGGEVFGDKMPQLSQRHG